MGGPSTQATAARSVKRRGAKASRAVFVIHSWLGRAFFLLLTLVTVSGTLAVFRDEIDWLIYPQMRVTPGPERVGLDQIVAAVRDAYPAMGFLGPVPAQAEGPRSALGVVMVSHAQGVRRVWVDPYRGTVLGSTPLMTPGYFLAQLHAYLLIPTWGYAIVCSFAFFLLASLITGLITYRKFWRGFFRTPRRRNLRTLMGDLHRLGGLWSIWFLVIMILTGLWYFWTMVGEPLLGFPKAVREHAPPQLTADELDRLGPRPPVTLGLDALATRVREAFPAFDLRYVRLPASHGAPVTFSGNEGEVLGRNVSQIHIEPYGGRIVGRHLFSEGFNFAYVKTLADALHFGDFAGLASKIVWFVFGAVTSALSVTGFIVFWKRSTHSASPAPPRAGRSLWRVLRPWGGAMGAFKPLNVAVLAFAAYASVVAVRFYGGGAALLPARFEPQAIGPWQLGAVAIAGLGDLADPIRPGGRPMILVEYCADCWPAIKQLWISAGETSAGANGARVVGQPGFAQAYPRLPARFDQATRLWLTAEEWDGTRHEGSWPVRPALP